MLTIPDAAIGAVLASVVGAVVTLVSLVISKENKTSEFRQAWIDALRNDLTSYLAAVNAIHDTHSLDIADAEERLKSIGPFYLQLNTATFNINLRLNDKEESARAILTAMSLVQAQLQSGEQVDLGVLRREELNILAGSKLLLKGEWEVVKRGEPTFRATKRVALAVIIVAVTFSAWSAIQNRPDVGEASMQSAPSEAVSPQTHSSQPTTEKKTSIDPRQGSMPRGEPSVD